MEDKIFQGEKLVIAGKLRDRSSSTATYTTDYQMLCIVYDYSGNIVKRVPFVPDATTKVYYCGIDTAGMKGTYRFRFVVQSGDNSYVVSQEDIIKTIIKHE